MNKIILPILIFCSLSVNLISQNWTSVNVGTTNDINCVEYIDASTIILGAEDGIIKSTNGGSTWTTYPLLDNLGNPITLSWINDMHFFDANTGVATGFITTGNSEAILRTTNGGQNWTIVNVNNAGNWPRMLNDIAFYSATNGVSVGTNGRVLRTVNAGTSWTTISAGGITNELKGVSFASSTIGQIVGNGVMLRTVNGGTSWTVTSTPSYNLNNVHFVNSTLGYAIGNVILKTTNAGVTWTQISTIQGTDIYGTDADTAFLCNSGVYKTSNIGGFWGTQASVSPGTYNDIDFLDQFKGFVVGNNGKVYLTNNAGEPIPDRDAALNEVEAYSPTLCPTNLPVRVKVRNFGTQTLTNLTINWSFDGLIQPSYNWTGTILSDSISNYITIGNYNFGLGAQLVKSWVSNPNGSNDQFIGNDTSSTTFQTQRLMGTYTIGGASPNFADFNSAVNAINIYGVCAPVIFNVRNGTYTGNLTLNSFIGGSAQNTITFQSESGDSSLVVLNSSSGTTITLNGGDYFRFNKLTIAAANGICLDIKNGANDNVISNCIVNGINGSTFNLISSSGTTSSTLSFENNLFNNGAIAISLAGISSSYATGININNNVFRGQASKGIAITYIDAPIIKNNDILSTLTTSFEGINYSYGRNLYEISKNKISLKTGSGIYLGYAVNSTLKAKVFNNMISVDNTTGSVNQALYLFGSKGVELANNTLYARGSSNLNAALNLYFPDTSNIKINLINNIIACYGPGLSVRIGSGGTGVYLAFNKRIFERIRNNDYYSQGQYLFSNTIGNLVNIYDWINVVLNDSNFINVDPQLTDPNNLHVVLNTSNYALSNKAYPLNYITGDFDTESRSATPDIGADEFNSNLFDIQTLSLSDSDKVCLGTNSIYANFINHGSATVNNFDVNWSVNGILQTPYTWNGAILNDDTTNYIPIGNYNFSAGNYAIKVWVTNPNNQTDQVPLNDTISYVVTAGGLNGNYIIGTAPSDYTSISLAIADLNTQGICGPVVFEIKPGTYIEQATLNAIVGASTFNTITFRSQNGDSTSVDWQFNATTSNNFVLKLNGTDNFILEHITMRSTNATYNTALLLTGGCNGNTVSGCRFIGKNNGSGKVVYGMVGLDNYNTFIGNSFISGYTALFMEAASTTAYERGNKFIKNTFYNVRYSCLDINFQEDFRVEGNIVSGDTTVLTSSTGLGIYNTKGIGTVNNNMIYGKYQNGLFWGGHSGGVYFPAMIYNNMIRLDGTACYQGIRISTLTDYCRIINNTALLENSTSTYGAACGNGSQHVYVYNNIFANTSPLGSALYHSNFTPVTIDGSDYNIFYRTSGTLIASPGAYLSLSSWQNATIFDDHSYQANPAFISSSNLHLGTSYYAENNGTNLFNSIALNDVDNEIRSTTHPDIGADEFTLTLSSNDAGVSSVINPMPMCVGNNPVKLVFKNYSSDTLHSVDINWSVNSIIQTPFHWTGNLATLQFSDTVTIGTFNYQAADIYTIRAWTSLPNGINDNTAINDSALVIGIRPRLSGELTIGGTSPDYNTFAQACTALNTLGVCGPLTFLVRDGIYSNDQINLNSVSGASSINTITFRSELGNRDNVKIIGEPAVVTNATDYLNIRDITIEGGSFSNYAVNIGTGTDYFNLRNCKVTQKWTYGPAGNYAKIDSCQFNDWVQISSSNCLEFTNNNVLNLRGTSFSSSDSLIIKNNTITCSVASANDPGLYIQSSTGKTIVQNNKVFGGYNKGIQLNACNGSLGIETEVVNNVVNGSNTYYSALECGTSSYFKVLHNSIYSNGLSALDIHGSSNFNVFNNTVVSINASSSYFLNANTAPYNSDYNNIYAMGGGAVPIYFQTTTYSGLGAYQAASGKDLHSISVDPQYTSSTDLFPLNTNLHNAGTGVGVTKDINNFSRNLTAPYIGAYENTGPPIAYLGNDSTYCHTVTLDAGQGATNILWSTGVNTQTISVANSGLYWVELSNAFGTVRDSVNITIGNCAEVWPGDANNDGLADNIDILELGIRFGATGGARTFVSNTWQAYNSPNWGIDTVSSGYNLNHADCNGDGIINFDDTLAVNLNYGAVHSLKLAAPHKTYTNGDIYFSSTQNTYTSSQPVSIDVYLGDATSPLQDFYGAAFNLNYTNNTLIQSGTMEFSIDDISWTSVINTDGIRLVKTDENTQAIYSAISRIDHTTIPSGYGKIGTLRFITTANNVNANFTLSAVNAYYIDNLGNSTPLTSAVYSININSSVGILESQNKSEISLFPNPNNGAFELKNLNAKEEYIVEVKDMLGRVIYTKQLINTQASTIELTNDASGVYWLQLSSKNKTEFFKLIIEN